MSDLKNENTFDSQERKPQAGIPADSWMYLLFQGLLSVGFIGYFAFRNHWAVYIFAHIGALGVAGFFGCFAGAIAKKKGFDYWKALSLGFTLPIILGIIVAYAAESVRANGLPGTCGGIVSLIVGAVIVISYSFAKQRMGSRLS
jgi:hypothetical protein